MYPFAKFNTGVLLILLMFAGFRGVDAVERTPIQNPDLLAIGGTEIEIHDGDTEHRFVLFGAPGLVLGEGTVSRANPESLRVDYTDEEGSRFSLIWFEHRGKMVLISPGGRVGTSHFDLQRFEWVPDPTFERLKADHETTFVTIAALGATVQERLEARGLRVGKRTSPLGACNSAASDTLSKNLGTGVTCGWTPSCRGFATSLSRSYCCFEAESDANHCCTNTWCYGCCDLLSCDAGCGLGDYGCFCGMSGFECVGPRFQ